MKNTFPELFKSKLTKITFFLFVILTVWWLWLQNLDFELSGDKRQLWAATYQIIALFGAGVGFYISKRWGGFKSIFGRAIMFFGIGLLLQSFGQSVYSYYIYYLQIDIPYPSIGDIGFFGSVLAYIYGASLLFKPAGTNFSLKSHGNKLIAILIPAIMLGLSYFIFLQDYQIDSSGILQTFLDFGYPFGQAIYVSIAISTFMLARESLGGIMRMPTISIIVSLVVQYIADYTFLYQSSRGTWEVGTLNDFLYLCSYVLMALALIHVGSAFKVISSEPQETIN